MQKAALCRVQGEKKSYSVFEVEQRLLLADADMLALKTVPGKAPAPSGNVDSTAIPARRSSEAVALMMDNADVSPEPAAAAQNSGDVPRITLGGGHLDESEGERESAARRTASHEAVHAD